MKLFWLLHYEPLARLSGLESLEGLIHTASQKTGLKEKHSDTAVLSRNHARPHQPHFNTVKKNQTQTRLQWESRRSALTSWSPPLTVKELGLCERSLWKPLQSPPCPFSLWHSELWWASVVVPSLPACIGDESLKPAAHGHVYSQHQCDPDQQGHAAHQEPWGLEH